MRVWAENEGRSTEPQDMVREVMGGMGKCLKLRNKYATNMFDITASLGHFRTRHLAAYLDGVYV